MLSANQKQTFDVHDKNSYKITPLQAKVIYRLPENILQDCNHTNVSPASVDMWQNCNRRNICSYSSIHVLHCKHYQRQTDEGIIDLFIIWNEVFVCSYNLVLLLMNNKCDTALDEITRMSCSWLNSTDSHILGYSIYYIMAAEKEVKEVLMIPCVSS